MADKRSVGHAYNIDFLNVVFAVSSLFVLVTTVWMVWDDYDREWKNYQRQFTRLELEVTRVTLAQAEQEVDQPRVAELTLQREAAEQQLVGEGPIDPVTDQSTHRSSPHDRVMSMLCQPLAGRVFHP